MRNLLAIAGLGRRYHIGTGPLLFMGMLACGGNTEGSTETVPVETLEQQCARACQLMMGCEPDMDLTECRTECSTKPVDACLTSFQSFVVCIGNALQSSADCDPESVLREQCGAQMRQYETCEDAQDAGVVPEPVRPTPTEPTDAGTADAGTACSGSAGGDTAGTECFITRECGSETWKLSCVADASGGANCECSWSSANGVRSAGFHLPSATASMCQEAALTCGF